MARFVTSIESSLSAEAAFDLIANFDTIQDWDPGVTESERLDSGELRVGSAFRVVSAFGPQRIPLTYVIRELQAPERVLLVAETTDFSSHDIITVEPTEKGSVLTYDATLTLHGFRKLADPALKLAFLVIGKRAEAGLQKALNPVTA